jgi:hypothetical protein
LRSCFMRTSRPGFLLKAAGYDVTLEKR